TAAVLDTLRPRPGEVALDLFCGAGLFAGALATRVGPEGAVIAVDADRAAVRDARHNLRGTPWARVHAGDVARVLARGGWPPPGRAGRRRGSPFLTRPERERRGGSSSAC